ncbi:DEAD/DEAH box helicase [Actinomadura sp. NPDC047616]|uniref:DEAD/DEAH box helicase n=1 Tax=Actinomadura sp. NPDC047616 TaxID=3155914 RepID=UPI0033E56B88
MADMGFLPDVTDILDQARPGGQRLLFSATLDNPVTHAIGPVDEPVATMDHHLLLVAPKEKALITAEIANREGRTILFGASGGNACCRMASKSARCRGRALPSRTRGEEHPAAFLPIKPTDVTKVSCETSLSRPDDKPYGGNFRRSFSRRASRFSSAPDVPMAGPADSCSGPPGGDRLEAAAGRPASTSLRAALVTWRDGDRAAALRTWADAGRVHAGEDRDDTLSALLADWTRRGRYGRATAPTGLRQVNALAIAPDATALIAVGIAGDAAGGGGVPGPAARLLARRNR